MIAPFKLLSADSTRFPVRASAYCQKIACPSAKEMPVPSLPALLPRWYCPGQPLRPTTGSGKIGVAKQPGV